MKFDRPLVGSYPAYYDTYFRQVDNQGPLVLLMKQAQVGLLPFASLSDAEGALRYAPGKWSVAEVLGHINDTERILAYRLLRLARFDATPLPGFEEDDFVRQGRFETRPLSELYREWQTIRAATLSLVTSLTAEQLAFTGTASGHPVSGLALLWILPAHAAHHAAVVRERYLTVS